MIPLTLMLVSAVVGSKVDSVVVYPDQVLVVRTARVSVQGPGELVFEDLPGALWENTVRIQAPGMKIGEVQVRPGYLSEPTPAVRRLEQKVEELEFRLLEIGDEKAVLAAKEEFLKSIKLGAPELISRELQQGKVSTQSWRGALTFMADELAEVRARVLVLDRETKEVNELLEAARMEYAAARGLVENRKDVGFEYDAPAGEYRVKLHYVIGYGASWTPYYELRARPEKDDVAVAYFSKLAQNTGEDWDRVKVVLSTTRPLAGVTAPAPFPWFVSLVELAGQTRNEAAGALAGALPMDAAGEQSVSEFDRVGWDGRATAVETGISLQYVIPGRVTLASGEPPKKLLLEEARLPVEFDYYALPRVRAQAFLRGRLANETEFVLLAGEASTYVGDEYTGSTWLPTVAPQESTEVSFGVDERVRVTRELVKTQRSRSGLFSKKDNDRLVFQTVVQNFHPKPVRLELVEQVPVSTQRDVTVKVHRVAPRPDGQDRDAGTYTWRVSLEPRSSFVVDIDFTVSHPPAVSSYYPEDSETAPAARYKLEGLF